MAELSANDMTLRDRAFSESELRRRDVTWGYYVGKNAKLTLRSRIFEWALLAAAVAVGGLSLGQWLLPGSILSPEMIGIKIGLSVWFGLAAGSFASLAGRGLGREAHIDITHGQFRQVWVNRKDESRLHLLVGFDEVSSIFVKESKIPFMPARLCVRFGAKDEVMTLMTGPVDELNQLSYDLWTSLHHKI